MARVGVRPAVAGDVPAIAAIQVSTWRSAYAGILPAAALDGLDQAAVEAGWREAVTAPPDPRARVLVAVSEATPVGFTTTSPAGDEDLDGDRWAELGPLLVLPEHRRGGHGSRLLAAAADHMTREGFRYAVCWVLAADTVTSRFLAAAGWAADGASRTLEVAGERAGELRLSVELPD